MIEGEFVIPNKLGLHARAAAQIVKSASAYKSKITLSKDGLDVDGKSIMGILLLAAARGSILTITTDGADEQAALDALVVLVESGFGEDVCSA